MKGGLNSTDAKLPHLLTIASRARANSTQGFTIVEVLIVLAIMSAMFVSSVALVSGRQSKVAFTQTINDVQSRLQQAINEVGSGYYTQSGNFQCTNVSSTVTITGASREKGTNEDCLFLGKVLVFNSTANTFEIYALAGIKPNTDDFEPADFNEANPKIVPQTLESVKLTNGVLVKGMGYSGYPGTPTATAMFISTLGTANADGALTGAQQVDAYSLSGTAITNSFTSSIATINSTIKTASHKNPSGGINICLESGTTTQSAILTVGGGGRSNATNLKIRNTLCS